MENNYFSILNECFFFIKKKMPLSIEKLQDILGSKGYISIRFYIMDGLCYYIELLHTLTMECCLMYIPSKYKFPMEKGGNVFKIKYTEGLENEDVPVDNSAEGDIVLSPDKNTTIADYIEGYYDQPIKIKNMSVTDSVAIRTLTKQLIRIKRSVQHLKYKVAIFYKNYICAIKRDNEIEVFTIKHFANSEEKRMLIVFDLELFYNSYERIHADINSVKKGIYNLLEKNQTLYSKILDKLNESKNETLVITTNARTKLRGYDEQIKKIESVLPIALEEERKLLEKIDETTRDVSFDSLSYKATLEGQLYQIKKNKDDIINNLSILRAKKENLLMNVDRVFFENSVMFDKILKNFASLK